MAPVTVPTSVGLHDLETPAEPCDVSVFYSFQIFYYLIINY